MNKTLKRRLIVSVIMVCSVVVVVVGTKIGSKASSASNDTIGETDVLEYVGEGKDAIGEEEGKDGVGEESVNTPKPGKVEPGVMTYKKGTVSHVCYLYIDSAGNVDYAYKDDKAGNATKVKLPRKKGKILAMFIKQSTSGMIWVEEAVSHDVLKKIVDVVKEKDKSYKGHAAVAYGYKEHVLTYAVNKKNTKTVKYTFSENK